MARSNYEQTVFLGGEWSLNAQGRSDLPGYHMALSVSLNGLPIQEGAWTQRSGTQFICQTYLGGPAKLLPYISDVSTPYLLEFTNTMLRVFSGTSPLFTTDTPTVTASSVVSNQLALTLSDVTNFVTGDDVMLISSLEPDYSAIGPWQNQVMQVTDITGSVVTCVDAYGNDFVGLTSSDDLLIGYSLYRIQHIATTYATADLANMRCVQVIQPNHTVPQALILAQAVAPQLVTISTDPSGNSDAIFSMAAAVFTDGPYLDQQGTLTTPETGTVNAYTGSITFTPASTAFTTADVGRLIRLYSQPAAWAVGTTYSNGDYVTDANGEWWIFTYSSGLAGIVPGTSYTTSGVTYLPWAPAPNAGQWAWGTITAQATTSCTVDLQTNLNSAFGSTMAAWRLGVYKIGQYPTCGLYYEGRLLLAGAVQNRFDMSNSNDTFNFAPDDLHGNVFDNHSIAAVLNAATLTTIYWFVPDHQGIIMGTSAGEWLIAASVLNDPLTPTSIQAHLITPYGSANVEPRRVGVATVFVQRYARTLLEYLSDTFSGRFIGKPLNELALHTSTTGIAEIAYQHEPTPIIWARMTDGSLASCTYRRVSHLVTEDPLFRGWARHILGGDYAADMVRPVTSMCVLPDTDGLSDVLYVVTSDTTPAKYFVEVMRPLWGVG